MIDPKMKIRTSLLLGTLLPVTLIAQTSTSDCAGAIQLCGGIYTEVSAPLGTGNIYEFTGACNASLETASLWYTFTVQDAGDLSFILDPANDIDDYDWGLFNITNGGCDGIGLQDGSSPEVNCNSYGSLVGGNGATGISTANGGTGTTNGPGDTNGPAFNANLPVVVGQTYALVVMNWSGSPDGYTIDFTQSTASIYDQTPPVPVSIDLDCGNQTFRLLFSEPMVTSTVEPADFTVTTPSEQVIDFAEVTPDDPAAYAQLGFTLVLPSALLETGLHTLSVTAVSANVEDPCGNIVVDTTFEFMVEEAFIYNITTTTACNGSNGALTTTHSGGAEPVTFRLAGTLLPNGSATGLGPGTYLLQVSDANNCSFDEPVTIPDHVLNVSIPQLQDSISCTEPFVTIEGVQVQPEQNVSYTWTATTATGTTPGISTSAAPEVGQPGNYTVLVTDPVTGCTDEADVLILPTAVPTVDLSTLIIPNVVSPNADGKNDIWRPFVLSDPDRDITTLFEEYTLTIFNRWGQVMHETEGGGQRSWNARDAAAGTYFYTVAYRAECGAVIDQERTGSITVLR